MHLDHQRSSTSPRSRWPSSPHGSLDTAIGDFDIAFGSLGQPPRSDRQVVVYGRPLGQDVIAFSNAIKTGSGDVSVRSYNNAILAFKTQNVFIKRKILSQFFVVHQIILLEESWKDLFLLNMGQWAVPVDLNSLLASSKQQIKLSQESLAMAVTEIRYIQDILGRFRQLSPDGTECGCLKAIVLFRPGKCHGDHTPHSLTGSLLSSVQILLVHFTLVAYACCVLSDLLTTSVF